MSVENTEVVSGILEGMGFNPANATPEQLKDWTAIIEHQLDLHEKAVRKAVSDEAFENQKSMSQVAMSAEKLAAYNLALRDFSDRLNGVEQD